MLSASLSHKSGKTHHALVLVHHLKCMEVAAGRLGAREERRAPLLQARLQLAVVRVHRLFTPTAASRTDGAVSFGTDGCGLHSTPSAATRDPRVQLPETWCAQLVRTSLDPRSEE